MHMYLPVCVSVYRMHGGAPKEGVGPSELEQQALVSHHGCWEQNLGPLEKQ